MTWTNSSRLPRATESFISENKTERECAASAIRLAEAAGYVKLSDAIAAGKTLKAGDKVYADIRGKSVIFVQIGTKSLEEGLNILGAHIDSPSPGRQAESSRGAQ